LRYRVNYPAGISDAFLFLLLVQLAVTKISKLFLKSTALFGICLSLCTKHMHLSYFPLKYHLKLANRCEKNNIITEKKVGIISQEMYLGLYGRICRLRTSVKCSQDGAYLLSRSQKASQAWSFCI
jgi:hypothetical protein